MSLAVDSSWCVSGSRGQHAGGEAGEQVAGELSAQGKGRNLAFIPSERETI